MKKTLLLSCIFFAGITFTASAMEGDSDVPKPSSDALIHEEGAAPSTTAPHEDQTAAALAVIKQLAGEEISQEALAQKSPTELKKIARAFLKRVDVILGCEKKHPVVFVADGESIAALKEARHTLSDFVSNARGFALPPQQIAECIFAAAAAAARLNTIAAPFLLRSGTKWGWVCVSALVGLTAVGMGAIHLGNVIHWWNVPFNPEMFWESLRNLTTAIVH